MSTLVPKPAATSKIRTAAVSENFLSVAVPAIPKTLRDPIRFALLALTLGGCISSRAPLSKWKPHYEAGHLAIVRTSDGVVIAEAAAPTERAYVAYGSGPNGAFSAFLAPPHNDGLDSTWARVCVWSPEVGDDTTACGRGFVSANLFESTDTGTPGYLRDVGGYLYDDDHDGWEDLTLALRGAFVTISGRTGRRLSRTVFDVGEGAGPKWFHGGRTYGVFSAFARGDVDRVALLGGVPVGDFKDLYCNVSRYLAVLEAPRGRPEQRHLKWSHYFGFHSATVRPKARGEFRVVRAADHANGCVHRYSDGRAEWMGRPVLWINRYVEAPGVACLTEQTNLYRAPPWTPAKVLAWETCARTYRDRSRGLWHFEIYDEETGLLIWQQPAAYAWSSTGSTWVIERNLAPGFDLGVRTPRWLELWRGEGPGLNFLGIESIRPRLKSVSPAGPRGVGSETVFVEHEAFKP